MNVFGSYECLCAEGFTGAFCFERHESSTTQPSDKHTYTGLVAGISVLSFVVLIGIGIGIYALQRYKCQRTGTKHKFNTSIVNISRSIIDQSKDRTTEEQKNNYYKSLHKKDRKETVDPSGIYMNEALDNADKT